MKLIAAPILILLLLTQVFSKWLLVVDYTLNKDYIAKNLCINREKPKLLCSGKCQLAKKMAAEENGASQESNQPLKSSIQEALFDDELNSFALPISVKTLSALCGLYVLRNYPSPVLPVFHPPALS